MRSVCLWEREREREREREKDIDRIGNPSLPSEYI
jgi:hypothetical protein